MDNGEEDEVEDEEGENDWLYELLKELANSNDEENEESEDKSEEEDGDERTEEGSEDELVEEGDQTEEEAREEDRDKGKIFFINTLFKEKKNEEEVPIKCGDPGPCLVTCKIRGVSIPDCLCDPGACGNIMPFEVYELLNLGPLKKSREVFTTADASIVSVAGIAEDIDKGKVRERSSKERKKAVERVKEKSRGEARNVEGSSDNSSKSKGKKKKISSNPEKKKKKNERKKEPDKGKDKKDQKKNRNKVEEKKKKKDPGEDEVEQKRTIRCSSFNRLLGKLKVLKRILRQEKGVDVHLVTNNSKWK
ncbi:hypothetical protein PIB30_096906 [Stylosanthes scabra]|uniref:Uncharacterized protein n=1 Tax=Stylosanthes scabra TaxID=79078 RepID=A0ABU6WXW8_9FABA|nr:hypothetical protein [Stylosanthes scabra]